MRTALIALTGKTGYVYTAIIQALISRLTNLTNLKDVKIQGNQYKLIASREH